MTAGATPGAVGAIIPAFGAFVVRGNFVVGLIVFAILVTIQFVVIASGSQRVAEVAARFTLDAMPGKQMAIDADVHAGALDAEGARRKREAVQREADFYGAMDGAGKFVKGDAIAALVIVALNLDRRRLGRHRLSRPLAARRARHFRAALDRQRAGHDAAGLSHFYRDGNDGDARSVGRSARRRPRGAALCASRRVAQRRRLAAGARARARFAASGLSRSGRQRVCHGPCGAAPSQACESEAIDARERVKRNAMRRPELALGLVGVDAVAIEIGADLAHLLAPPLSDALLDRIGEVRRALAADIGIVLPGVRLRDDLARDPRTYGIRVRDRFVGAGRLDLERLLAVADEAVLARSRRADRARTRLRVARGVDRAGSARSARPTPARWFSIRSRCLDRTWPRSRARMPPSSSGVKSCTRCSNTFVPPCRRWSKRSAATRCRSASLHRAFALLLREGAWPRDPIAVLEAMLEAGTHDPRELAEAARRAIVPDLLRRRGVVAARAGYLRSGVRTKTLAAWCALRFGRERTWRRRLALRARIEAYAARTPRDRAAVVCTAALRPMLADFLLRSGLRIGVYAYGELPNEVALATGRGHRRDRTERAGFMHLKALDWVIVVLSLGVSFVPAIVLARTRRAQHHGVLRGGTSSAVVADRDLAGCNDVLDRHAESRHESGARRRRRRKLGLVVVLVDRYGDRLFLRALVAALGRADRSRVLRAALCRARGVVRARLPRDLSRAIFQLLDHRNGQSRAGEDRRRLFGWPRAETLAICVVVPIVFAATAGLWGVMVTDMIQFCITMSSAFAAAYFAIHAPGVGGLHGLIAHIAHGNAGTLSILPNFADWRTALGIFVIPITVLWWSVWYPGAEPGGGSYVAQRMLAARTESDALFGTFAFQVMHYALRPWPWIVVALASTIVYPTLHDIQLRFPASRRA